MNEIIIFTLILLLGVLIILLSIQDSELFFSTGTVRTVIKVIGRKGARIFYGLLGLGMILLSLLMIIGTAAGL